MNFLKRSARKKAENFNEQANVLKDEGQDDQAIALYLKAIEADQQWASPWYNLGLLYKYNNQWKESLECNEKASALDPEDEAAIWNLGIAATALGEWAKARAAWKSYGIKITDGEGPIEENFGLTPIRLNGEGGEVVWCNRIDPARAIITNIPFVESGHRFGDLLLHDGAPNGYRLNHGEEVPVFDELELLMPSEFGTYSVTLENALESDLEALITSFVEHDLGAENWETSVRFICRACSEGKPYEAVSGEHAHDEVAQISTNDVNLAVAAISETQIKTILSPWLAAHPETVLAGIECLLEPALKN